MQKSFVRSNLLIVLVAAALFAQRPVLAQQTVPASDQQPGAINRDVSAPPADATRLETTRQITLDVVVSDKSGKPVAGLKQGDLVVLDNKKPARITSFRAIDRGAGAQDPVSVLILIDEVNTPFQGVAFERDSVRRYVDREGGHLAHPVTLMFLSDENTDVFENLGDDNSLAQAFSQHETRLRTIRRSEGFYGAADRFTLSVVSLQRIAAAEAAKPGRKILVWISPGWAYLSGPNIILTNRQQQSLFASVVATEAVLRRARITLSTVNPIGANENVLRSNYYEQFLKGVTKPSGVEAGNLSLQVIATQSGGQVLQGSNDNAGELAKAAADADTYYEITLDTVPAEHANEYHSLEVKTEQSGLRARTRTGYYAQP